MHCVFNLLKGSVNTSRLALDLHGLSSKEKKKHNFKHILFPNDCEGLLWVTLILMINNLMNYSNIKLNKCLLFIMQNATKVLQYGCHIEFLSQTIIVITPNTDHTISKFLIHYG